MTPTGSSVKWLPEVMGITLVDGSRSGTNASAAHRSKGGLSSPPVPRFASSASRIVFSSGSLDPWLSGGVVHNSVLNGRLCREAGFERVFILPYPGDEVRGRSGVHLVRTCTRKGACSRAFTIATIRVIAFK